MRKMLSIRIGEEEFLADLCLEEAPKTCEAFERAGEFESFVFSAKCCDAEITYNTPIRDFELMENEVLREEPGNVVFYSTWTAVCIFFDRCEPFGSCNKFAQVIPEDLPRLAAACRRVWEQPGQTVTTSVIEVED